MKSDGGGILAVTGRESVSRVEEALTDPAYMVRFARACASGESEVISFSENLAKDSGSNKEETISHLLSLAVALLPESLAAREIGAAGGEASPAPGAAAAPARDEYTDTFAEAGDILEYPPEEEAAPDGGAPSGTAPTPALTKVPSAAGLDRVGEAVHDILESDAVLRDEFAAACLLADERPLRGVAHTLYSRLERRHFRHDCGRGQEMNVILAALYALADRTPRLRGSVAGVVYSLRETLLKAGERESWSAREYAVAALLEDREAVGHLIRSALSDSHAELLAVTRRVFASAREAGYRGSAEHFSDHVFRVRFDLFPDAPGADFSSWLQERDEECRTHLAREGLKDSLTPEEEALYVTRALRQALTGDRYAARQEYRKMYAAAAKRASSSPAA